MSMVRTSLLNGIAVVVKMLTLLGLNKVLAVYIGPAGYTAVGQLQNAVQIITGFASGAINTGVVKYTAEYKGEVESEVRLWKTAGSLTLIGSFVIGALLAVFNVELARVFLKSETYASVFLWFAAGLIFFSYNTLLLAILNGRQAIVRYVLANIAGSVLSFVVTLLLATQYGIHGALIALVTYQSFNFLATFFLIARVPWFRWSFLAGKLDLDVVIKLGRFALMSLTSAACIPVSQILVRNHLSQEFGLVMTGYWEAMWRLSSAYLLMITTTLGVYYLPKLSELVTATEIKREIQQGYKIIVPITVLGCSCVYLLRDVVVHALFSSEFYPMRELFAGQMVGDTLKIISWILAYVMLSKAMLKLFVITEVASCLMFYILAVIATRYLGFEGVVWAYAFNYFLYCIVMYIFVYRKVGDKQLPVKGEVL